MRQRINKRKWGKEKKKRKRKNKAVVSVEKKIIKSS